MSGLAWPIRPPEASSKLTHHGGARARGRRGCHPIPVSEAAAPATTQQIPHPRDSPWTRRAPHIFAHETRLHPLCATTTGPRGGGGGGAGWGGSSPPPHPQGRSGGGARRSPSLAPPALPVRGGCCRRPSTAATDDQQCPPGNRRSPWDTPSYQHARLRQPSPCSSSSATHLVIPSPSPSTHRPLP